MIVSRSSRTDEPIEDVCSDLTNSLVVQRNTYVSYVRGDVLVASPSLPLPERSPQIIVGGAVHMDVDKRAWCGGATRPDHAVDLRCIAE